MSKKAISAVICTFLGGFVLAYSPCFAADINDIQLIETNSADCAMSDGKLISIKSNNQQNAVEVWLDRWFMDVQTADHTQHILTVEDNVHELGCSLTRRAEKQHWTIHSTKPADNR